MALNEAQAAALVDQLEEDAATLNAIVQGADDAVVPTEGGDVPTIAKAIKDAADTIPAEFAAAMAAYLAESEDDLAAAVTAAEEAKDDAVSAKTVSETARDEAGAARNKAEEWADKAEDDPVEEGPDRFSARHQAAKAAASAAAAQAIAENLVNVLDFKGGWDASTEAYPADPEVGDLYTITTAGTISGTDWRVGDEMVYAPSETWIQVGRDLTAAEIVTLLTGTFTDAAHGTRGGGTQHAEATESVAGFMSAADKVALNGVPAALAAKADASAVTSALNGKMNDPTGTGLVVNTGADGASVARAVAGVFGQTLVTNGDGVAANPTVGLLAFSLSIADDSAVTVDLGANWVGDIDLITRAAATIRPTTYYARLHSTGSRSIDVKSAVGSLGTAATLLTDTELTGTTGADGVFTLSGRSLGRIDVQNRTDALRTLVLIFRGANI
ncbi:hypothetical protein [Parvibaculum sp.]|uniref:hypothetical protein n=1 Tax=Parvibaculum sp. TaxID=2024848 RepID=UPI001DEE720D|nr:hypothetical protein [Parvibaculum sp.]MBX3488861.1 hypothetical protein [Parvibaculum sp.]